jgi:hypothetical protein
MNHPVVQVTAHVEFYMSERPGFRFRPIQELKHPCAVVLQKLPSTKYFTELPSLVVLSFAEHFVTEPAAIFHGVWRLVVFAFYGHKQIRIWPVSEDVEVAHVLEPLTAEAFEKVDASQHEPSVPTEYLFAAKLQPIFNVFLDFPNDLLDVRPFKFTWEVAVTHG